MLKKNGTHINGKWIEMREASAVERTRDTGSRKAQDRVAPRKEWLKDSGWGDWRRKSVKGWRADEVRKVEMMRCRGEFFFGETRGKRTGTWMWED